MKLDRRWTWVVWGCSAWLTIGCGDDSTSDSAGTTGSSGTAGDSATPTGTSSPSGPSTMSASDTTSGMSSATSTSDPTTQGATETATGAEGGSTTSADTGTSACVGLDQVQCMDAVDCMPIGGRPIEMPGDGACLGAREFIECQDATGCAEVITYACAGVDATIYEFGDACVPEGWVDCPPPPIELMPCP